MAGEGNPKTVATTPPATHQAIPPAINATIFATKVMLEDEATIMQPLAMVPAEGSSRGPVGATLRSADQGTRHPAPPLCCTVALAPQDCKIQGTRIEPIQKSLQGNSIPIGSDRKVDLQGGSGNRIVFTASDYADVGGCFQ